MLETILLTVFTYLGKLALSYFDSRQASADAGEKAVSDAANQTAQDTAEIADAQAQNNAIDRGGASDVAARLRKHLGQSGSGGPSAG